MNKKKKDLKLRLPFRILIVVIGVILVVSIYYPVRSICKLHSHNYSISNSIEMYKDGMYEYLMDREYSETVDKTYHDKDFNKEYIDSYMKIKYHDSGSFLDNINRMLKAEYSIDEINLIYSKVSDKFINEIADKRVYDLIKYLEIDNFKEDNYERYVKYFNGNYKKTVLYVNISLDKNDYEDPVITDKFSITMLVNKHHGVSKEFIVPDLVDIDSEYSDGENKMNKEAADAFVSMAKDAKKEGYKILANSSYRDYERQESLYNYYLKLYGEAYNKKYVTKPGFSEHETGLSVDIKSKSSAIFANSKEYKWVLKNGYKYGFIHRYPKSKIDITGISSESWHFRYVGKDIAKYVYENGLSYEEYYAMFIDK